MAPLPKALLCSRQLIFKLCITWCGLYFMSFLFKTKTNAFISLLKECFRNFLNDCGWVLWNHCFMPIGWFLLNHVDPAMISYPDLCQMHLLLDDKNALKLVWSLVPPPKPVLHASWYISSFLNINLTGCGIGIKFTNIQRVFP